LNNSREIFPDDSFVVDHVIEYTVKSQFSEPIVNKTEEPITITLSNRPNSVRLNGRLVTEDFIRVNQHGVNVIEIFGLNGYSEVIEIEFINPISVYINQFRPYMITLTILATATFLVKIIEVIKRGI
jgi:hypothetical protein